MNRKKIYYYINTNTNTMPEPILLYKPAQLYGYLTWYTNQFNAIIPDYKTAYINYKNLPGQTEYEQIYLRSVSDIQEAESIIFLITNVAQTSIDAYTSAVKDLNSQIQTEKTNNIKYIHVNT